MEDGLYQQFEQHFNPLIRTREMSSYFGNTILSPENLAQLRKEFAGYAELDSETSQRLPLLYVGIINADDIISSSVKQCNRTVDCLEIKIGENYAHIVPLACRKDIEQGSIDIDGYKLPFRRYTFLFAIDQAKQYEWRLQKFYLEDPILHVFEEIAPIGRAPVSGIFGLIFNDLKKGFSKGQKLFNNSSQKKSQ